MMRWMVIFLAPIYKIDLKFWEEDKLYSMEKYIFTERHAEVFARFMVAMADTLDKQLEKQNNNDNDARRIWLSDKYDNDNDNDDNACFIFNSFNEWNLTLKWCNTSYSHCTTIIGITIEISTSKHPVRRLECLDYGKQDFHSLVGTHRPCVECDTMKHNHIISEKIATAYDNTYFCHNCFSKVIKHEEECCCCMENNLAVWYKLPCNHVLHKKCFDKLEVDTDDTYRRKCPLCRAKANCYETTCL